MDLDYRVCVVEERIFSIPLMPHPPHPHPLFSYRSSRLSPRPRDWLLNTNSELEAHIHRRPREFYDNTSNVMFPPNPQVNQTTCRLRKTYFQTWFFLLYTYIYIYFLLFSLLVPIRKFAYFENKKLTKIKKNILERRHWFYVSVYQRKMREGKNFFVSENSEARHDDSVTRRGRKLDNFGKTLGYDYGTN